MQSVTIFTTRTCPYCLRAKALLARRQIAYREVDLTGDTEARERLAGATGGRRTVPQIFIGDTLIGGSDELADLDRRGELARLVSDAAAGSDDAA